MFEDGNDNYLNDVRDSGDGEEVTSSRLACSGIHARVLEARISIQSAASDLEWTSKLGLSNSCQCQLIKHFFASSLLSLL